MDTASRLQRAISYWQQSWFAGQATAAPTTYYVCDGNVVPDCAGAIVGVRCHPPVVIILVFRHRPATRSHNRIIWSPVCNARELNHYSYLLGVLLLCSDSNCYAIVHIPCEYWYVDGECYLHHAETASGQTKAGAVLWIYWKPPTCMQSAPMTQWKHADWRWAFFVWFSCGVCVLTAGSNFV